MNSCRMPSTKNSSGLELTNVLNTADEATVLNQALSVFSLTYLPT